MFTFKLIHEDTGRTAYYGTEDERGAYILQNGRRFNGFMALVRFCERNGLVYVWL